MPKPLVLPNGKPILLEDEHIVSESQGFDNLEDARAREKNPSGNAVWMPVNDDNETVLKNIANTGMYPTAFRGKSIPDMLDIIDAFPELMHHYNLEDAAVARKRKEAKDNPGVLPSFLPNSATVPERDIGTVEERPPNLQFPSKPGGYQEPLYRKGAEAFGLPPAVAQDVGNKLAAPKEQEKTSGVSMLRDYLIAQDQQRFNDVQKRILMNQTSNGPVVKVPMMGAELGTRD